jgi:hypothetical protein
MFSFRGGCLLSESGVGRDSVLRSRLIRIAIFRMLFRAALLRVKESWESLRRTVVARPSWRAAEPFPQFLKCSGIGIGVECRTVDVIIIPLANVLTFLQR